MSKETTIVFIYDTKKLQNEADDPATAILYFHPTWVSDQQKTVLCGQLMGIIFCLRKVFNAPEIISLESGKFCVNNLRVNERYLLAVGTDRNVADWILLNKNRLLSSLIEFYHRDIEEIAGIYGNSDALSAKLYHVCETYLKIISYGGNTIFSVIPSIILPKSASNVFIETLNVLQYLQTYDNVLGGLVLYHNKVLATQLSPKLTKHLVLTDPYRIKSPAEVSNTDFHLPIGVQLLQVYIAKFEYDELNRESEKLKNVFGKFKNSNLTIKRSNKIDREEKETNNDQQPIVVSTLKRDCSLLFTAVPEEDTEVSPNKNEDATIIRMKKPSRPKFLNLKNKIGDIKEITPSTSKTPFTPFSGNAGSVISTPMTDLNKVLHINTYQICTDPEPEDLKVETQDNKSEVKSSKKNGIVKERSNSLINLRNGNRKNGLVKRQRTVSDPSQISREKNEYLKDISTIKEELIVLKNKRELSSKMNFVAVEKSRRKSLTLPLKSLSSDSGNVQENSDVSSSSLLTPLMQKLSSLAFERKSSGISSFATPTPLEHKDVIPLFKKEISRKSKDSEEFSLKKCTLFVCGQQDTVLLLLLKNEGIETEFLVNELWETTTDKLGSLEKQLNQCMDSYSNNAVQEQEPYSFLCLDADWDTLKRGGPWESMASNSLSKLHRDFKENGSVTEILCKGNDSIMYGVHMADSEIFYHQSESANNGLPTPSDLMGHVPVRAKRSLERDHSIVLL